MVSKSIVAAFALLAVVSLVSEASARTCTTITYTVILKKRCASDGVHCNILSKTRTRKICAMGSARIRRAPQLNQRRFTPPRELPPSVGRRFATHPRIPDVNPRRFDSSRRTPNGSAPRFSIRRRS